MSEQNNQQPTHFAVPVDIFAATTKVLGTLPYNQVSPVMQALGQCRPITLHDRPDDKLVPLRKDTTP